MAFYEIVKDDLPLIHKSILDGCGKDDVDLVLINAGTGITKRDVTMEAVQALIHKEIVDLANYFGCLAIQKTLVVQQL
ncbi:hypothetical protein NCCP28_00780 [Niallia sp. NCCP-28]|nr:hypothetical protein NCCP28_00780 [Niallia sp. NCCP-28]